MVQFTLSRGFQGPSAGLWGLCIRSKVSLYTTRGCYKSNLSLQLYTGSVVLALGSRVRRAASRICQLAVLSSGAGATLWPYPSRHMNGCMQGSIWVQADFCKTHQGTFPLVTVSAVTVQCPSLLCKHGKQVETEQSTMQWRMMYSSLTIHGGRTLKKIMGL